MEPRFWAWREPRPEAFVVPGASSSDALLDWLRGALVEVPVYGLRLERELAEAIRPSPDPQTGHCQQSDERGVGDRPVSGGEPPWRRHEGAGLSSLKPSRRRMVRYSARADAGGSCRPSWPGPSQPTQRRSVAPSVDGCRASWPGLGEVTQRCPVDLGVDRGRAQATMAQDLADVREGRPFPQHLGGHGVAQPVRGDQPPLSADVELAGDMELRILGWVATSHRVSSPRPSTCRTASLSSSATPSRALTSAS